jgi:hypothetical protein
MKVALVDDGGGAFFLLGSRCRGSFLLLGCKCRWSIHQLLGCDCSFVGDDWSDSRRSVMTGSGDGGGSIVAVSLEEGWGQ